jgi:hypothetical protein
VNADEEGDTEGKGSSVDLEDEEECCCEKNEEDADDDKDGVGTVDDDADDGVDDASSAEVGKITDGTANEDEESGDSAVEG